MQSTIVHQPRIAWDAALVLIQAAEVGGASYARYRDALVRLFGVMIGSEI